MPVIVGITFNNIRACALNGNEWQHNLRLLNDKNNITERRILPSDTFNYQLSINPAAQAFLPCGSEK